MEQREHSTENAPDGVLARLVGSWLFVGIPLAWGVYATAVKAIRLFQ